MSDFATEGSIEARQIGKGEAAFKFPGSERWTLPSARIYEKPMTVFGSSHRRLMQSLLRRTDPRPVGYRKPSWPKKFVTRELITQLLRVQREYFLINPTFIVLGDHFEHSYASDNGGREHRLRVLFRLWTFCYTGQQLLGHGWFGGHGEGRSDKNLGP